MSHEDIDVSRLIVLVGPDHWMVAHLDRRIRLITALADAGEHVHVWPRRVVPRVPLFVLDRERAGDAFHRGVRWIFDRHRSISECRDIVLESDAAHELREPGPDGETVELAEKRGVVKADPSAAAFLDVLDKGGLWGPRP